MSKMTILMKLYVRTHESFIYGQSSDRNLCYHLWYIDGMINTPYFSPGHVLFISLAHPFLHAALISEKQKKYFNESKIL